MTRHVRPLVLCAVMAAGLPAGAGRHNDEDRPLSCDDSQTDRPSACEIKEFRLPAGPLTVDGRSNGGIRVRGTNQGDVLVRARIQATAESEAEARQLLGQVRVETKGEIRAEGPQSAEGRW